MSAACHTKCNLSKLRSQHGAAFIVMMVILVLGSASLLVSSLTRIGPQLKKNERAANILVQAKEAVIGYAANGSGSSQRPGDVMRPDSLSASESSPNYDGASEMGCLDVTQPNTPPFSLTTNATNIRCLGRLPWKNYGLSIESPSESDPIGLMPWYAASSNLFDPAIPFNSDLLNAPPPRPWLTVRDMNGNVLSNRVVFVIMIPSEPLPGQSRQASPNLGGPNQYLDSITVPASCTQPCTPGVTYKNYDLDDDYIMGDEHRWIPDPSDNSKKIEDTSYQFNDKLIYVTIDELMPLIEKRVGNEIKKVLNNYYMNWGVYPFAAPFTDPTASSFTGQSAPAKYNGLLPFGNNVIPTWAATPTVSISGGGDLPDCELIDDAANNSRWRCGDTNAHGFDSHDPHSYVSIPENGTITITGTLRNVGRGLWRTHNINDTKEVRAKDWSGTTVLVSSVLDNATITGSLDSSGNATVVFSAKGKPSGLTKLRRIELRDIQDFTTAIKPPVTIPATPTPQPVIPTWLLDNNWHQLAYYAVSQQYAPGGDHSCTTNPCLSVNGQSGGSNKKAVVVMMGSRLKSQLSLPSGNIAKYLEGENATTSDLIYENKPISGTFNDQVISVEP